MGSWFPFSPIPVWHFPFPFPNYTIRIPTGFPWENRKREFALLMLAETDSLRLLTASETATVSVLRASAVNDEVDDVVLSACKLISISITINRAFVARQAPPYELGHVPPSRSGDRGTTKIWNIVLENILYVHFSLMNLWKIAAALHSSANVFTIYSCILFTYLTADRLKVGVILPNYKAMAPPLFCSSSCMLQNTLYYMLQSKANCHSY